MLCGVLLYYKAINIHFWIIEYGKSTMYTSRVFIYVFHVLRGFVVDRLKCFNSYFRMLLIFQVDTAGSFLRIELLIRCTNSSPVVVTVLLYCHSVPFFSFSLNNRACEILQKK